MSRLPPLQGQSTLKQLEHIANETTTTPTDQSSMAMPLDQSETARKPRRRRKKKKPPVEQATNESTLEIGTELPVLSAGVQHQQRDELDESNNAVRASPPPPRPPPPAEPYKPVDLEQLLAEERYRQQLLLGDNVIEVKNTEQLRKPEKLRYVKNSTIEPHGETVYIQTTRGFKATTRIEANTATTKKNPQTTQIDSDEPVSYGEGVVTFIRNLSRFSLGALVGYSGILVGGLQAWGEMDESSLALFDTQALVLSILSCVCGIGSLSSVDPIGRGGVARLFRFDPASLANICVLAAVLLSAVADVLIHQVEPVSGTISISPDLLIVHWLRFTMFLLAWLAMAFSEAPGGALYWRFKEQNRIDE